MNFFYSNIVQFFGALLDCTVHVLFLFQYWIPTHNKLRVVGKATVLPYSFLVRYWILLYSPLQFLGALLDLTLPLLD